MSIFQIAVDGPSGSGKSTLAKGVAKKLNIMYLDTGAMYRTCGLCAIKKGIDPKDEEAVNGMLSDMNVEVKFEDGIQHMILNGEDVTAYIRSAEVSQNASVVAAIAQVRSLLLDTQRSVAREYSVIMNGRDIGTVVLPNADVKIFLTASAEVRARRRWLELQQKGALDTYEQVLHEMIQRDLRDSQRDTCPLRQADDAVLLDTSHIDLEESIRRVVALVREAVSHG